MPSSLPFSRSHTLSWITVAGITLILFSAGWLSISQAGNLTSFTDSLTSTQYRDPLVTSAWWDTTNGEIKRFPFAGSEIGNLTGLNASDVVVRGDLAYIASVAGMQVADIRDPTSPLLISSAVGPLCNFIDAAGDVALLGCGSNGLVVVDITDPTTARW